MAALVSSVRIGIHFSHERHCTRELSNRFTFGSDAKAALRSSTGRALLALQQTRKGDMTRSELGPRRNGVRSTRTHTRFARQLFRCASQGMEQYVELGRRRIHLSQDAQRTRYASNFATYGSDRR